VKVALYARVSMEETDDGSKRYQEPENQLQPLRQFAKAFEYEVVGEYVDRASGGDGNRPQFKQMFKDAFQMKFQGVIVWRIDRFSREGISSTLAYIEKLKTSRVWLKSMSESWLDTKDANMSELILSILAWAASEERRKISERTKAGIKRLKAIGQWKGGRPKKGGVGNEPRKDVGQTNAPLNG
jgi:DNA invertase Pin-like site-specific DNA recombinase